MTSTELISTEEILKHDSVDDCWLVIDNQVWDFTTFAPQHPGGADIIFRYAGHDATQAYSDIHAPSLLTNTLTTSKLVGLLDISTISDSWSKPPPTRNPILQLSHEKPPLRTLLSSHDIEEVASKTLSAKTWAFYSSAATDLITSKANKTFYDQIWLRPRILRDVRHVDTACTIQGVKSALPIFVAPAAMAKLVHPDGEKGLAKACASRRLVQCISTNASFPIEEIKEAAPDTTLWFQLYVNKERHKTEHLLIEVWNLGVRTLMLTVDAPVSGKREADERVKADESIGIPMSGQKAVNDKRGGGYGRIMSGYIDCGVQWKDLRWLKRIWKGRFVIKGIQGVEDARRAVSEGVDGIVISNHGGRSLDTSTPAILALLELRKNSPEVFLKTEVYIDGGIRRGTDVLKALCLGAKAVSIGRTFLYALNYGQEGVEHFIDLMRDELEISMRMMGVTSLDQVRSGMVNTLGIDGLVPSIIGEEEDVGLWKMKSRL